MKKYQTHVIVRCPECVLYFAFFVLIPIILIWYWTLKDLILCGPNFFEAILTQFLESTAKCNNPSEQKNFAVVCTHQRCNWKSEAKPAKVITISGGAKNIQAVPFDHKMMILHELVNPLWTKSQLWYLMHWDVCQTIWPELQNVTQKNKTNKTLSSDLSSEQN